jgi:hypothetical protein
MKSRLAFAAALVAAVVAAGAAQAADAGVLVFDMGPASSAVWPGAKQVTAADAGWLARGDLTERDAPSQGDPIWTNAFTQDCLMGSSPNSFRLAAAPGPWSVHVMSGIGGRRDDLGTRFWDFDVSVGNQVWRCQLEAPSWSGPYRFPHHTFSATSRGELAVNLNPRNAWTITGIVAWQPKDEVAARRVIARIEEWAPAEERAKWREGARPPAGPIPVISAADRARGYLVWHRHWATPIYPWTNPTLEELNPTLRVFASPGEYEPLTFTVRPLRRLRQSKLEVTALGTVPVSAIDVRKARFLRARRNYSDTGLYRIVPDILDRWGGGPLTADENATFWLTIRVPKDARPGLYRGRLRFSADGKAAVIPVLLRVMDIVLQEDPKHTYGIYYYDPFRRAADAPDEISRQYWIRKSELEHADMVAHGTRNVTLDCWSGAADQNGEFEGLATSFATLQSQLDRVRRFGFQPPFMVSISTESIYEKYMKTSLRSHLAGVQMPAEPFFAEVTALVRTIEQERQRRGWPEFIYQPFDEPSSDPDVVAFMTRVFAAVKAAGVRTYTTAAPQKPGYQPFQPYVDVWCTQTFLPEHDAVITDMQERPGREYWCYPNDISGENDHTPVAGARMTYGFGFWRSGFVRLIPWIYQYSIGDPENYLDGDNMDFLVRSQPDGTPVPVALWEGFREGYDDMRYIYTLAQAIAQAKASPSAALQAEAAAAQHVLDSVWSAVPVLPQYQYSGFWSPEEMDVRRWQIAERAERLQRMLRKWAGRSQLHSHDQEEHSL